MTAEQRKQLDAEAEARRIVATNPKYQIRVAVDRRDNVKKFFIFGPTGFVLKTANPTTLLSRVRNMIAGRSKQTFA